MKKRLLSAFLSLCMMLTMLPAVAFAAPGDQGITDVTGDGPMTTATRQVDLYLYTTQLYKLLMLADDTADETATISKVELLLYEDHPMRGDTIEFVKEGLTKAETDRFHSNVQNYEHKIEPSNMEGLRISYTDGNGTEKQVTIAPDSLRLDSNIAYGPLGGVWALPTPSCPATTRKALLLSMIMARTHRKLIIRSMMLIL